MTSDMLDPRLHAFHQDIADIRLKGQVEAARFVEGKKHRIIAPVVDVRKEPRLDSGVDTQLIRGQDVLVFEQQEGFAWMQAVADGYVGYIDDTALGSDNTSLTHRVIAPRTFLYPGPDLRLSPAIALSLGSQLTIIEEKETRGTRYGVLQSGEAVVLSHIQPLDRPQKDYVTVAEQLIHTPYLWGGVSGFGLDCSGLVQLAMAVTGKSVLRDSDMQASTIGHLIKDTASLQRGDLVFWKGHVAIMMDEKKIIHANGTSMDVRMEPLQKACKRIALHYGQPICFRRPS